MYSSITSLYKKLFAERTQGISYEYEHIQHANTVYMPNHLTNFRIQTQPDTNDLSFVILYDYPDVSGRDPILPIQQPQANELPWSSGLCDCGADLPNCCITCWCPCITFGRISEIVDKGSSSCISDGVLYTLISCLPCCPRFYSCLCRSKLRQQHSVKGRPCGDYLVHCCCESCALCQEYRELKTRGFDMSKGWQGTQHGGVEMPPVVQAGMHR